LISIALTARVPSMRTLSMIVPHSAVAGAGAVPACSQSPHGRQP
jgi:hypothetical protein